MKSMWFDSKSRALEMRRQGISMTSIERELGIPRSTLSGWFREVKLTDKQRTRLMKNSRDGWQKAREQAVKTHRAQKATRLLQAQQEAVKVVNALELTPEVLELALAFLYLGEGAKKNATALASSDPMILKFVLSVLRRNYGITANKVRCDLHLRMDQDADNLKTYWSAELGVPLERFRSVSYDKRSEGRPTYEHYKGVCVINCGSIAIQRKLIYLYNLFCARVAAMDVGV